MKIPFEYGYLFNKDKKQIENKQQLCHTSTD